MLYKYILLHLKKLVLWLFFLFLLEIVFVSLYFWGISSIFLKFVIYWHNVGNILLLIFALLCNMSPYSLTILLIFSVFLIILAHSILRFRTTHPPPRSLSLLFLLLLLFAGFHVSLYSFSRVNFGSGSEKSFPPNWPIGRNQDSWHRT